MTTIDRTGTPTALERAREALAETQEQLHELNLQHEDLSLQLGEALAASRLGDKKAERAAGGISMKRAGVETERDRLRLQATALGAELDRLEAAAAVQRTAVAGATFQDLTGHARRLEATLVEQMRVAAATAAELWRLGVTWEEARIGAAQAGHAVAAAVAPRNPAGLFQPDTVHDTAARLAWWQAPPWTGAAQTPARLQVVPDQPEGETIVIARDPVATYLREGKAS